MEVSVVSIARVSVTRGEIARSAVAFTEVEDTLSKSATKHPRALPC